MQTTRQRLGTPGAPNATTLLLLGSGELGEELLSAAQELGVETVAVDRYENAPAMQVADALATPATELRLFGKPDAYAGRSGHHRPPATTGSLGWAKIEAVTREFGPPKSVPGETPDRRTG